MSDVPQTGLGPGTCLTPARGIHFAVDHGEVVVLDVSRDRYSALGPGMSAAVRWAADPHAAEPADAAHHLQRLLAHGILVPASQTERIPEPAEPRGMTTHRWTPHMSQAALSGSRATTRQLAFAIAAIARADRAHRRGGTAAVLSWLERRLGRLSPAENPADAPTAQLADAHVRARMLYPRRIECLVGSAALAAHAWSAGIPAVFVIGVQKYPFIAHSWVEHDGRVVNDRSEVSRRLAHILRLAAPQGAQAR